MAKVYRLTNNKTWKSLYFDNERVYLSSKEFDDPEAFVKHFPEKGLLQPDKDSFPVKRIRGLEYFEGNSDLIVKDADDKRNFEFINSAARQEFVDFIKEQRGFVSTLVPQSKYVALIPSGLGVIGILIMCTMLYHDAAIQEAGGEVEISGRKKGAQIVSALISRLLGTKGVIAIGAIGIGYCMYSIYKHLKSSVKVYKTVWARSK